MLGHRERLKTGDEHDAFSRKARKFYFWKPGQLKAVKAKFNRRVRREAKRHIEEE